MIVWFDGDLEVDGDVKRETARRWLAEAGGSEHPCPLVVVDGALTVSGDLLADYQFTNTLYAPPDLPTWERPRQGFHLLVTGDLTAGNLMVGGPSLRVLVMGATRVSGAVYLFGETPSELMGPVDAPYILNIGDRAVFYGPPSGVVVRTAEDLPEDIRAQVTRDEQNEHIDFLRFYRWTQKSKPA